MHESQVQTNAKSNIQIGKVAKKMSRDVSKELKVYSQKKLKEIDPTQTSVDDHFFWAKKITVDIFYFKILVLLVSRGTAEIKSRKAFEIAFGEAADPSKTKVSWTSSVVKNLFYYVFRVAVLLPEQLTNR